MVLKSLHVDMTGRYTCEVSTEGIFETVKAAADMTVVGGSVLKDNSYPFADLKLSHAAFLS